MAKTKNALEKELKGLKASFGDRPLFAMTTYIDEDDEQERTIFLSKPDRMTRKAAEKIIQNDTWKATEVFLRGMYQGGDDLDEILSNDDAFMIAQEQLVQIIKLKSGNVQKV